MFQFLRPLLGRPEPSILPSSKDAEGVSTFHSPDGGTLCDCGHPRQCTHTLSNLPERLTAEEIVDRAAKKEQETAMR